jgi:hypothetical protein
MEQHSLDLQLDLESDSVEVSRAIAALRPLTTATLTNSPGCTPAPSPALSALRVSRPLMRSVRVDAWSEPVSASWARPSRALRKVARRALETEAFEPI